MPVYDVAANLRTAEPVSNMYQGKAMRLALANQELANEALEIQNEQADDVLAIEQDKAATAKGNLVERMRENMAKLREDQAEATVNASAAYASHLEQNPDDVEGANEAWKTAFTASGFDYEQVAGENVGVIPPEVPGAILAASGKDYREVMKANAKLTEFEKVVSRLKIPGSEKQKLLLRYAGDKATGSDAREKKIMQYMEVFGVPLEKAIKLVDGKLKVSSTPNSRGFVTVTDTVTNSAYLVPADEVKNLGIDVPELPNTEPQDDKPAGGMLGEVEEPEPWAKPIAEIDIAPGIEKTVITKSQDKIRSLDNALGAYAQISPQAVMEASGSAAMAKRGANALLQFITLNAAPRFAESEALAENAVQQFNQTVRSGIVNSDRFPVWEQKMVSGKMLPDPNNVFKDPEGEALKLSNVLQTIQQFRENEVAMQEGRVPNKIPRIPIGVKSDPIPVESEEEALSYPAGTYVLFNGQVIPIVEE